MAADVGEIIERRLSVRTAAGALVDADATPTYSVTLPDGTAGTSPTVQHAGTGDYFVLYPTTTPGMHLDSWTAQVGGVTSKQTPGTFRVRSATLVPLLDLDEARTLLGVGIDPVRDERIRDYIDAAAGHVERFTGRTYRRRQVVDTFTAPPGYVVTTLVLRSTPVASLVGITNDGVAVTAAEYRADLVNGVVYALSAWAGPVAATYIAGRPEVADEVLAVNRRVLQHLWSTQSGGTGAPQRTTGQAAQTLAQILADLTDIAPGFA